MLLLDFGFLVFDMLTHDRVIFLEYQLVGCILLVFVGRVVMSGTGAGY
jgi:hypothetical protein